MPDIFDNIAAPAAPEGDIFDRLTYMPPDVEAYGKALAEGKQPVRGRERPVLDRGKVRLEPVQSPAKRDIFDEIELPPELRQDTHKPNIWGKVDRLIKDPFGHYKDTMRPADIADAQVRQEAHDKGLTQEEYMRKVYPEGEFYRRAERYGKDVQQGALGTLEGLAGVLDWKTNGLIGKDLALQARKWQAELSPEEGGFADAAFSGIGSMATFYIPGMGVAKGAGIAAQISPKLAAWAGAGAAGVMEAATEAGTVYENVLANTRSVEDADRAASETFWLNIPLIVVTNKLGVFGETGGPLKRGLISSQVEGLQETGQTHISGRAEGRDVTLGEYLTSYGVGALTGGGFGALSGTMNRETPGGAPPLPTAPKEPLTSPASAPDMERDTTTGKAPNASVYAPVDNQGGVSAPPEGDIFDRIGFETDKTDVREVVPNEVKPVSNMVGTEGEGVTSPYSQKELPGRVLEQVKALPADIREEILKGADETPGAVQGIETGKRVKGQGKRLKLTRSQEYTLELVRQEVEAGEAGTRAFHYDPEAPGTGGDQTVTGIPSTFPEYFKNKGYLKKEALAAIDKALSGKPLGKRQRLIVEDLNQGKRDELVEQLKNVRTSGEVTASELKEGDTFKRHGEVYRVKEVDDSVPWSRYVTIKNSETFELTDEESLSYDRGTLEKGKDEAKDTFTLEGQQAPKQKASIPKQETLIDVQPRFPEGKIPTKDAGNPMLDEMRAREAEGRQTSFVGKNSNADTGGYAKINIVPVKLDGRIFSKEIWKARKEAMSWAKEHLKGKSFLNDETGWDIRVGKGGIAKAKSGDRQFPLDHLEAIRALPELLNKAKVKETRPDRNGNPDIKNIHILNAPLSIEGDLYDVKLTIKETVDGRVFYDHSLTEMKKTGGTTGQMPSQGHFQGEGSAESGSSPEPNNTIPPSGKKGKPPGKGGEADAGGYSNAALPGRLIQTAEKETKHYAPVSRVELPELVEIAKELLAGRYPKVRRKLRLMKGHALGLFRHKDGAAGTGRIELKADIAKDPDLAAKVLAHEIGHAVDWLPDKTLSRGNILGRVASFKGYLKHLLKSYPDSTHDVLTPKERRDIRAKAQKEIFRRASVNRNLTPEDKVKLNKMVQELYRKRIQEEIQKRGLFTRDEIMKELKGLTQLWKPFDENVDPNYTKYRYSSKELFADSVSVLFNHPEFLQEKAPKFYQSLFRYLENKPEVNKLYWDIQDRLSGGKVQEERAKREQEMFERGEKTRADKLDRKSRHYLERLKEELVDVNEAIIRRVKKAKGAGKEISPEDNPVYWLEEANYWASQAKEYLRDVQTNILDALEKSGIDRKDLASLLLHERVIHERGELFNPLGFTPETSRARLDAMKHDLGDERYRELERIAGEYRRIRKETIIPFLKETGMFSPELIKKIEENDHYATFSVVAALEKKNGRHAGIGSQIFRQIGTLEEIENPFTATMMKDIALVRAGLRNQAAEKTVEFMKDFYPQDIRLADTSWNGKAQVPVESKDPDLGLVRILKGGKVAGYYMDRYVADSFNADPTQGGITADVLRQTNIFWKELFVNRNPGFWLFNMIRDYKRAAINLPGGSMVKLFPEYMKALKPAFREAFGYGDETVEEMNRKKMLITVEARWGLSREDEQIERMLQSYGLTEKKWNNLITKRLAKLWKHWGDIGQGIERIPKIAGYRFLKTNTNLTDKEIGHVVRAQVGSPDFMRRGKSYNLYNNLLLFSNAIKEGWRGDYEVIRERPAEYAWKRAKYSIMPKLVMYAALLGLLGDWMKEKMEKVPSFDLTNYIVIPLGETESGKTVYLRIPMDETGRFIGGVFWKALNAKKDGDIANLFDYMAGQAPTLTPTVGMVADTVQYFSGKNPYDWFRGKSVIPEQEFEAGGWRSHEEFLKHMARSGGSGIIYKFQSNDVDSVKTELEKVLDFPVVSNILGRFVKVSDSGKREEYRKVAEGARQEKTNQSLDVRDRIIESINAATKEGRKPGALQDMKRLFRTLKDEGLLDRTASLGEFRHRYNRYAAKAHDDPRVNAVNFASSNDEKVALLKKFKREMRPADYEAFAKQLRLEGLISTEVRRASD